MKKEQDKELNMERNENVKETKTRYIEKKKAKEIGIVFTFLTSPEPRCT